MARVLIVDDRVENRRLLRALLETHDCTVDEAPGGAEALAMARQAPPDLIISESRMPVMDGFALLRQCRSEDRLKRIPFIVQAADSIGPQDERLALELGAEAHRFNAAEPAAFMAHVRNVLARDEHDLAAREARLRAIFDGQPECVKLLAADGSLLEMNPAGLRMLEADSFQQLANRCVFALVVDEHRAAFRELTDQVFRGHTGCLEFQITGLKGAHRWLETHASPLRDATGAVAALLGITRDITDRKRAELALRENEARFRALFEQAAVGVAQVETTTGRYLRVNQRYCDIVGYAAAEMREMTFQAITHSEDLPQDLDYMRRLVAGELREFSMEKRYVRKDGSTVWARLTVSPMWAPGERPEFHIGVIEDITARKRAENALRESEERYRQIVETAEEGVWTIDAQARTSFVNPKMAQMLGYTVDEMLGRPLTDFMDDEGRAFTERQLARRQQGISEQHDFKFLRKDGAEVWASLATNPFFDANGAYAGGLAMIMDITARRRTEETLRKSEERFRELAETIQEVFWVADASRTRTLYVSPAYERVWGRSCQSLYVEPNTWTHALHPEDRERVLEAIAAHPVAGAYEEEYRILRADGEVRWIRDEAFPVRDATGAVERFVGVARDITERRRAQEALRLNEERFRVLIENASDLIGVTNNAGVIRFLSPSVEQVLGYRPEEMVNRSVFEFVHPDDVALTTAVFARAVAGPPAPVSAEYRARRADGQWRILQTIGRSIPDLTEEGFIVLNSRDVTESRQLEEQFRQAQKMEAIGQLAGGVAHDFNNILTVMLMQAEHVAGLKNLPPQAREGLNGILLAAEKASSLTRQLLLFGRRQVMQSRDLDLNDVVTSLARMLQRIIGEDVRLQLHLHPAALLARADAGMLDQVLMNLAVNARDAMPGGGQLLIETGERFATEDLARVNPEISPGRYVWLSVSDTGEGIPADILPRVFDPFFTTKEPGKGTGLGLATVFGIVKQHHGWIDTRSEPGRGATFQVFLPACAARSADQADAGLRPAPRGGSEAILVVEDEAEVRDLTSSLLERHGYRVLTAASGVEALELWREHGPSVVLLLTDLVMPGGLSGQQLARRLQEDRPNLKVIFTSGYSAEIAGREMELRSGENFVQKPFSRDLLLEIIRRCLDATPRPDR